jgi:hypothetical protein
MKSAQFGMPSQDELAKHRSQLSYKVRKWWNWQTHHLEGVAPKGVGVQIPPSAPTPLFRVLCKSAFSPVEISYLFPAFCLSTWGTTKTWFDSLFEFLKERFP